MKADHWFRVYTRIIDNPKLQTMDAELFRQMVNYWALAKLNDGVLPPAAEIAWRLRRPIERVEADIKALMAHSLDLLEKDGKSLSPTEWEAWQTKAGTSTERVKRHRNKRANVNETLNETLKETPMKRDVTHRETTPETANGTENGTQRRGEEKKTAAAARVRQPDFEQFEGVDPQQAISHLIDSIAATWPMPGNIPRAREAASHQWGFSGKEIATWVDSVQASAAMWEVFHRVQLALKPKHFVPTIERWFTDGDYSRKAPDVAHKAYEETRMF